MLWAVSLYHMHTHTQHTHAWWCVSALWHIRTTAVWPRCPPPPLLRCLTVSIHSQQPYLSLSRPHSDTPVPAYQPVPALEMFVCASRCRFSVRPCYWFEVFFFLPVVAVFVHLSFGNFSRSAKLEFCTLPLCTFNREKKEIKKKRRGRR